MTDPIATQDITPLERRAIEVRVAAEYHRAVAGIAGDDVADAALAATVDSLALQSAQAIAAGRTLGIADLWEVWQDLGGEGRLDLHLDELSDHTLRFHVSRCAYADLYTELGLAELGVAFSCRRDKPFAEALVPGVRVDQSATILEGAERCEFTYTLEDR